jgi:transposase
MKHYSKEFKEEALKLSDEIGLKKAAQQLGVAYYTLADWRSIRRNAPPVEIPSAEEQAARIRELERENAELQKANEILKDALGNNYSRLVKQLHAAREGVTETHNAKKRAEIRQNSWNFARGIYYNMYRKNKKPFVKHHTLRKEHKNILFRHAFPALNDHFSDGK